MSINPLSGSRSRCGRILPSQRRCVVDVRVLWVSRCCGRSPGWSAIPEGTSYLPCPKSATLTPPCVPGAVASLAHLLPFLRGFCPQPVPSTPLGDPAAWGLLGSAEIVSSSLSSLHHRLLVKGGRSAEASSFLSSTAALFVP